MKLPRLLITICILILLASFSTSAQSDKITADQTNDDVNGFGTVCGKVASAHYAVRSKGQSILLNVDEPYPKEIFTILIGGSNRAKFGTPETKYQYARVCVAGKITSYRGTPEIVATEPSRIVEQK